MDNLTALAERTDAVEPDPAAPFSDDPEQRALVGAWATSILVVSVVIFMIAWRRHTQAMKKAGLAAVESTSTSAAGASDDAQWSGDNAGQQGEAAPAAHVRLLRRSRP